MIWEENCMISFRLPSMGCFANNLLLFTFVCSVFSIPTSHLLGGTHYWKFGYLHILLSVVLINLPILCYTYCTYFLCYHEYFAKEISTFYTFRWRHSKFLWWNGLWTCNRLDLRRENSKNVGIWLILFLNFFSLIKCDIYGGRTLTYIYR